MSPVSLGLPKSLKGRFRLADNVDSSLVDDKGSERLGTEVEKGCGSSIWAVGKVALCIKTSPEILDEVGKWKL